jgi:hypothetical protein
MILNELQFQPMWLTKSSHQSIYKQNDICRKPTATFISENDCNHDLKVENTNDGQPNGRVK